MVHHYYCYYYYCCWEHCLMRLLLIMVEGLVIGLIVILHAGFFGPCRFPSYSCLVPIVVLSIIKYNHFLTDHLPWVNGFMTG